MTSILGTQSIQHPNGTAAVTIASTGRVAQKIQSAFNVGIVNGQSQSVSGTTKLNFRTDGNLFQQYDINGDFDNTDNKFTAPVTGIYVFHVSIYDSTGSQTTNGIQLYINGARKQNLIMTKHTAPTSESFTGGTTTYKMNATDYAQIYHVASGSMTIDSNAYHTYWQGYFVGAT